jgi:competence protein ComFA
MEEKTFVCPRCGNRDPRYVGFLNGKPYCRLCLPYSGKEADHGYLPKAGITLVLGYPLSPKQKETSDQVLRLLREGKNVLIHAVTGAGKTELVYAAMAEYLGKRLHVGFATPRRDVVIDLYPRIAEAFPKAKVIAVYGSHTEEIDGDILVLTTHQLYRYPSYFDLLILDEIDAFPYRGDPLLRSFFRRSVKGNYVLLSATPEKEDIDRLRADHGEVVTLLERYHHAPLPVPAYEKIGPYSGYFRCLRALHRFRKEGKPVFVFAPTLEAGRKLFLFLSLFEENGSYVSSKEEERKLDIERFKGKELGYLVTTSILERGVTVKDLQVIVFEADHPLYSAASLIQIAGRVGRKIGATGGEVLFLAEEKTKAIEEAIEEIKKTNEKAHLL